MSLFDDDKDRYWREDNELVWKLRNNLQAVLTQRHKELMDQIRFDHSAKIKVALFFGVVITIELAVIAGLLIWVAL